MKRHSLRLPRQRFTPEQKSKLLDRLARRPWAVTDFAATHGIGSSTLFRWLRQRRRASASSAGTPRTTKSPFQPVSLAQLLGTGGSWAGEVQLPDGTQVRWGAQPPAEVLLQVLACLRRPC